MILAAFTVSANDSTVNHALQLMGGAGYPPYEFVNENGEPDGFNVDLMKAIMKETGRSYTIELRNWKEVIKNLEGGGIDGVIGITYTSKRAEMMKFSFTQCLVHQVIVVKEESDIQSMKDVYGRTVGVHNSGVAYEYMIQHGITSHLLTTTSYMSVMQLLLDGKCDAILCSEETVKYLQKKMGFTDIRIIESGISPGEYGPAVVWRNDTLLMEINNALYKLDKSGELDKIRTKWFDGFDKDKYVRQVNIMLILAIILVVIIVLIMLGARKRKNANNIKRLYLENMTLLRSMPIGVIIYEQDGRMTFINSAIKSIFGIEDITEDELHHLSIYEDPCISDELKNCVRKGEVFNKSIDYNLDISKKNGYLVNSRRTGILYMQLESLVLFNKAGAVDKYIVFMQDKTENHKSDLKLRQSEMNLRLALETGKVNVWYLNVEDKRFYTFYGENFFKEGDTLEEILNLIHTDNRSEFEKQFEEVVSGKSAEVSMTIHLIRKRNGRDVYVENHSVAVYNKDKELTGVMGTLKDISDEYYYHKDIEHSKRCQDLAIRTNGLMQWSYECDREIFESWGSNAGILSELFGKDGYMSVAHINDRERIQNIVDRMRKREDFDFNFEVRIKGDKEQNWHYALINGVAVKDEKGKVISYIGFVKDNTKWRRLNIMLIDKNVQLNMVLEAGNIIPLMWNQLNNKLVITSPEMKGKYDIFDTTVDGLTMDKVVQNMHPDDRILFRDNVNALLSGATNHITVELRYDVKGEYKDYFEVKMLSEVINVNNHEMRIVGYMQNITERKKMITDLQQAKEMADQSNKLKSAFLANMSHEIRTPLNAIVGFSEMLMYAHDDTEKREYCNVISANNELLLRLVSDILDLSKIESGMIDLKVVEFDVSELFMQIYDTMMHRVNNDNVQLIWTNKYRSCKVHLDPERLSQVVINFLTNAIKFTPKGYIKMEYDVVEGGILVKVSDTGIGIPEDKLEKVFERFFKVDSFAQGTGLGMAICKAIVEAKHGKIGVNSKMGKGSTFWAFMPTDVVIDSNVEEVHVEDMTKIVKGTVANATIQDIAEDVSVTETGLPEITESENIKSRLRILVVEDNESNYALLSAILKGDHILSHAVNGAEAVDMQAKNEYDVILMDVNMPVMNGLDATREIRKTNVRIPIIAVTANAFESDKKAALDAGCTAFIAKPIKKQQLLNVMRQAMNSVGKC